MKNVEFYCGGFGNEEKIISKLAEENENIHFYGKMEYIDVLYLESQCDILPALYNPTLKNHKYAAPNKFYEALMLGKSILAFENTGIDEMIKEYSLGIVCKDYEKDIFTGLNNLIKKIEENKIINTEFKKIFREKFSWNIMEKKLLNVYKNI